MARIYKYFGIMAFALTACADFPELDGAVSERARNADFPQLVALDGILNDANDFQIDQSTILSLKSRIARLRARAARLQKPVIDQKTRAKLAAAVARHS